MPPLLAKVLSGLCLLIGIPWLLVSGVLLADRLMGAVAVPAGTWLGVIVPLGLLVTAYFLTRNLKKG